MSSFMRIGDRHRPALADELIQLGESAEAVQFNSVATEAAVTRFLAEVPIQVLVNNADLYHEAVMSGIARQLMVARAGRSAERVLQRDPAATAADDPHCDGVELFAIPGIGNRGQPGSGQSRDQSRAAWCHAIAGTGGPRHHRECRRPRHHRIADDRADVSARRDRAACAYEACRPTGRGGRAGRILGVRLCRIYPGAGDLDQRRRDQIRARALARRIDVKLRPSAGRFLAPFSRPQQADSEAFSRSRGL